jgi:hypothetical protein
MMIGGGCEKEKLQSQASYPPGRVSSRSRDIMLVVPSLEVVTLSFRLEQGGHEERFDCESFIVLKNVETNVVKMQNCNRPKGFAFTQHATLFWLGNAPYSTQ